MSYTRQSVKPIKVFYSYSHKDEVFRDEIEKCLVMLKRQGIIESWHDRKIGAGNEWAGEINEHLNTADIILLLVSRDFLASDYCYDVEVKQALERHEAGQARVIPIILRACEWKHDPFNRLQALPKDARPVTKWEDPDEAFQDVAKGIRQVVEEVMASEPGEKNHPKYKSRYAKPRKYDQDPSFIPHLIDRREELDNLEMAFRKRQPERPFICVIHGGEMECHDMFIQRLMQRTLPGILNLKGGRILAENYLMDWPSVHIPSPDPFDSFRKNLTELFGCSSETPKKKLAQMIAREKDPVVIRAAALTTDWRRDGRKLLESFIKCWSEWPDLTGGKILIVCITFKYEKVKERDFLPKLILTRHNRKFRRFFDSLNLSEHYKLPGTILKLGPVNRNDTEHWVRTHARKFLRDEFDIDDCINKVSSIFASREAIEMAELVPHLKQMLGNRGKDN